MNTVNWRRVAWITVFFYVFWTGGLFAQESLLPELQRLRPEYPTPMTKAQIGDLLTRVAASRPGYALLLKLTGNNCPAMHTRVSCDYIVATASGQGYDVLRDSEGFAIPVWNEGDRFTADRYVYVSVTPVPNPGTNTPPVGTPAIDIKAELDALLDELVKLSEANEGLKADILKIQAQQAQDRADVLALVERLSAQVADQKPNSASGIAKNILLILSALGAGLGAVR